MGSPVAAARRWARAWARALEPRGTHELGLAYAAGCALCPHRGPSVRLGACPHDGRLSARVCILSVSVSVSVRLAHASVSACRHACMRVCMTLSIRMASDSTLDLFAAEFRREEECRDNEGRLLLHTRSTPAAVQNAIANKNANTPAILQRPNANKRNFRTDAFPARNCLSRVAKPCRNGSKPPWRQVLITLDSKRRASRAGGKTPSIINRVHQDAASLRAL